MKPHRRRYAKKLRGRKWKGVWMIRIRPKAQKALPFTLEGIERMRRFYEGGANAPS